ncbi:sensor histidine kinase YesM [Paenibacillus marchantiophytorum]|uniref:Sensor histidine kinase YesM n=1 Tax=Paenibacillus marchantiophytorum TaxID=1619310 RepID=A0ABQ2BNJ6_9BACL|nr:sensor histidine kinase [Paenibacillus marchantiophytorum]GGI43744.1 sensor histidine kinase YesM [Paenibacillus marchantiophytorum]
MLNRLRNMNLMKKLIVLLILFVVIPILVLDLLVAKKLESITEEQVGNALLQLVEGSHLTLDRESSDFDEKTEKIMISQEIQSLVSISTSSEYERFETFKALDKYLSNYSTNAVRYSLFFSDTDKQYSFVPNSDLLNNGIFYSTNLNALSWFKEVSQAKGKGVISVIDKFGYNPYNQQTVAYLRQLNSIYNGEGVIGYLAVSGIETPLQMDFTPFDRYADGEVMMLKNDNTVLATNTDRFPIGAKAFVPADKTEGVYKLKEADGVEFMCVLHTSENTNTKLLMRVPVQSIISDHISVQRLVDLIMFIYFLILILASMYFIQSILKPISRLARITNSYHPGRPLAIALHSDSKNEIVLLNNQFIRMTDRLNQTIYDQYELELKHKEIELSILHTQINPHLLYNTLESVYWHTLMEGASESAEMIKDLSLIMRIGLSKGKLLIPVMEEMNHAEAYVRLQLFRYEYAFQVHWDMQEEAKHYLIPKVILQPIIENAILHGIKNMSQDGELWIKVRKADERLIISIEDNGYRQANVEMLNAILKGKENSRGFGIINVQKRIQLHFGEHYGLHYSLREGQGVRACLVLPALTDESGLK